MRSWFWFTIFPGRNNSSGHHPAFRTMTALSPQARELTWGVSTSYWMYVLPVCVQNWGSNLRMGALWDRRKLNLHWPLTSTSPASDWQTTVTFWASWNSCQFRVSIQQPLKCLIIFFFPGQSYPGKKQKQKPRSIWGRLGERLQYKFLGLVHSGSLDRPTGSVRELTEGPRICFYDTG